MKTLKYICVAAALGATALLPSCKKDFLETTPTTSLSDAVVESTLPGVEVLVNGIHGMVYNYSFAQGFGHGQTSMAAQLDMLSDDGINTQPAYFMGTYRYTSVRDPYGAFPYYAWDYYYTIIQHTNKVLTSLEKIKPELDESTHRLWATAYAFRAWAYHNLVQLYGKRYVPNTDNPQLGVLLRLTPSIDRIPRSTVGEVYKVIDADIAKALEHASYLSNSGRKNDMREATVAGIAARIALTKQDWAKAAQYAAIAIDKSGAKLQSGDALNDGFNNMEASEWIWGYKQNPEQNFFYGGFGAHYTSNFNGGSTTAFRHAVNRDLYDAMGPNDVRRKWWVCLDLGHHIPTESVNLPYFRGGEDLATARWEITGQSVKFRTHNGGSDSRMDYVLMRLGELYYIKAEAEAMQGQDAAALATLKTVMLTRDPSYAFAGTGQALKDEIIRNKRIDLWLEGQAFFDMKRLGRIPNRIAAKNFAIIEDLQGKVARQKAEARNLGGNATSIPKTLDDKNWEFAIPYDEIKGNAEVKQNPL